MARYDLFYSRMNKHTQLGRIVADESQAIEDKLFDTDYQYREGFIYDWDMSPLEKLDFKHEKIKTHKAEGYEVEYYIHFRPYFYPEYKFKDEYYIGDGKERLGFFIDVPDYDKGTIEKWIVCGKDDRTTFDRYNTFKCNWCLEWMDENGYHNSPCAVRYADDATFKHVNSDLLGGSSLEGTIGVILPSNKDVQNMQYGTRFILSDSHTRPQVYKVTRIKDNAPLGVTKLYLAQDKFNQHTDFVGRIEDYPNFIFKSRDTIIDMPEEFGGSYHMICDCIDEQYLPERVSEDEKWELYCGSNRIYYKGDEVTVKAIPPFDGASANFSWKILLDGEEVNIRDLVNQEYLDILVEDNYIKLKVLSKDLVKYKIGIRIVGNEIDYSDEVQMEVLM